MSLTYNEKVDILWEELNSMKLTANASGTVTFIALSDTPSTYVGQAGKFVSVNSNEIGLEFVTLTEQAEISFLTLHDTPDSYSGQKGKTLVVNTDENKLEFVPMPVVPDYEIPKFIELPDTPNSYNGNENKVLVVNSDGTGLIFKNADETGTSTFIDLVDTPEYYGTSGQILAVNETETALHFVDPPVLPEYPVPKFTDLPDTPDSYSGQTGKMLVVKNDETGVEFAPVPSIKDLTGITAVTFYMRFAWGTPNSPINEMVDFPEGWTWEIFGQTCNITHTMGRPALYMFYFGLGAPISGSGELFWRSRLPGGALPVETLVSYEHENSVFRIPVFGTHYGSDSTNNLAKVTVFFAN